MELGLPLLASATLMASLALSMLNIKGSVLIYSELSSADNAFNCKEPASQILLGQIASNVAFAASNEPCLFPNTHIPSERSGGYSVEIFHDVLNHVAAERAK